MSKLDIFKALSNETRLSILKWLKEPEKYFRHKDYIFRMEMIFQTVYVLVLFVRRQISHNQLYRTI